MTSTLICVTKNRRKIVTHSSSDGGTLKIKDRERKEGDIGDLPREEATPARGNVAVGVVAPAART